MAFSTIDKLIVVVICVVVVNLVVLFSWLALRRRSSTNPTAPPSLTADVESKLSSLSPADLHSLPTPPPPAYTEKASRRTRVRRPSQRTMKSSVSGPTLRHVQSFDSASLYSALSAPQDMHDHILRTPMPLAPPPASSFAKPSWTPREKPSKLVVRTPPTRSQSGDASAHGASPTSTSQSSPTATLVAMDVEPVPAKAKSSDGLSMEVLVEEPVVEAATPAPAFIIVTSSEPAVVGDDTDVGPTGEVFTLTRTQPLHVRPRTRVVG